MFLYLTSLANKTLDGLIPFLPKSPKDMKVSFIPTAADLYDEKPWLYSDRDKLTELGFQVEDLDIKNKNAEQLRESLSGKDIIFVSGGTTSYLLEKAKESGFLEVARELVNKGIIYIGSSAGSMLAGPNIEIDKVYDDKRFGKILNSYDALGLVDFVIVPHADRDKYAPYIAKIFKEYGNKYNLKRLNDNQAILVTESRTQTIEV